MNWHEVLPAEELPVGTMRAITLEAQRIALYNVDGAVYATQNTCTHEDAALTSGFLEGKQVECPLHGARFDVTTGKVTVLPAAVQLKTYQTKVEDGKIFVGLSE